MFVEPIQDIKWLQPKPGMQTATFSTNKTCSTSRAMSRITPRIQTYSVTLFSGRNSFLAYTKVYTNWKEHTLGPRLVGTANERTPFSALAAIRSQPGF